MRAYRRSMRRSTLVKLIAVILLLKAILIGWITWGRAELMSGPPPVPSVTEPVTPVGGSG
jgi:hypothetical protein